MRLVGVGLLILLFLSACASEQQTAADELKTLVAAKMKDPASATFADLRLDHEVLCGVVNAKNSFGAYSGADRFWATKGFVDTRSEALSRDQQLADTPASRDLKSSADLFDKGWSDCQAGGAQVD